MNKSPFMDKFESLLKSKFSDLSTPEKQERVLYFENLWKCFIKEMEKLEQLKDQIDKRKMNSNENLAGEWERLSSIVYSMYLLLLAELDPENQGLLKLEHEESREFEQSLKLKNYFFSLSWNMSLQNYRDVIRDGLWCLTTIPCLNATGIS